MPNGLFIRCAREADLIEILELYQQLILHAPVADAAQAPTIWRDLLARPGVTVFVADHDGRVSATCTLVVVPNLTRGGRAYALVENVVTWCDLRSCGYGRAVLEPALSRAWEADCYRAVLLLEKTEESGVPTFYQRVGFGRGVNTGFEARSPLSG